MLKKKKARKNLANPKKKIDAIPILSLPVGSRCTPINHGLFVETVSGLNYTIKFCMGFPGDWLGDAKPLAKNETQKR